MTMSLYGATGSNRSLKKSGYTGIQTPTMTPEQQQLLSGLIGGSREGTQAGLKNLNSLASGGTPEFWEQQELPAKRDFGQLLGGISSRFSGMGSGAKKSSGYQNVVGGAASSLSQDLAARRGEYTQQAIRDLLGLSESLLGQRSFETSFLTNRQKTPSAWQQIISSLGGGIGSGLSTGATLGAGKWAGLYN